MAARRYIHIHTNMYFYTIIANVSCNKIHKQQKQKSAKLNEILNCCKFSSMKHTKIPAYVCICLVG